MDKLLYLQSFSKASDRGSVTVGHGRSRSQTVQWDFGHLARALAPTAHVAASAREARGGARARQGRGLHMYQSNARATLPLRARSVHPATFRCSRRDQHGGHHRKPQQPRRGWLRTAARVLVTYDRASFTIGMRQKPASRPMHAVVLVPRDSPPCLNPCRGSWLSTADDLTS